jgi:hypothetical protein
MRYAPADKGDFTGLMSGRFGAICEWPTIHAIGRIPVIAFQTVRTPEPGICRAFAAILRKALRERISQLSRRSFRPHSF